MKYSVILAALLGTFALTACSPDSTKKPTSGAYQLTAAEMQMVGTASNKFFQSKVIVTPDGKTFQGESLGCMGSDSDRDLNVTCTGNQPEMQGGAVMMREREILCNYAGNAAGCKKKA